MGSRVAPCGRLGHSRPPGREQLREAPGHYLRGPGRGLPPPPRLCRATGPQLSCPGPWHAVGGARKEGRGMMAATMTATTIVEPMTMTDAISDTWRAIRRRHRDVPAVALSIVHGPGSGHAGVDWDADPPSLRIGARTVSDGPEAILGSLLHQAAHSLLRQRRGRTRGTQGPYHPHDHAKAARDMDRP